VTTNRSDRQSNECRAAKTNQNSTPKQTIIITFIVQKLHLSYSGTYKTRRSAIANRPWYCGI